MITGLKARCEAQSTDLLILLSLKNFLTSASTCSRMFAQFSLVNENYLVAGKAKKSEVRSWQ
jgi:hypothetical protein